ncbi:MAG: YjgN family protein [Piscinibacter sp.]
MNTNDSGAPGARAAIAWQDTRPDGEASPRRLPLRFTGSGSEYFRIWIVNLLLTLVTLGIYYPWAKVRRLRYFHGNTLVGEHPLGFHADPKKMLRGYVLVALLLTMYSLAGRYSPGAGFVALLVVAAVWPALLKSSMQFRLANTSWRGLRFRFRGSVGGAYAALLPFFVPVLILVGALLAVPDERQPPSWFGALMLVVFLGFFALAPWCWWRLKKFQHDHYAYGREQTALTAGAGSFYGVFMKTSGVGLLASVLLGVLVAVLVGVAAVLGVGAGWNPGRLGPGAILFFIVGVLVFALGLLVVQLVPRPYFTSRMQNLLWSGTASPAVGFESALRFWPLFGVTLKNWLLIVLTLGLYWPFAAVAVQRLRLEAVTVLLQVDPQTLEDDARAAEGEAAGDAAGDLFGLDIGL